MSRFSDYLEAVSRLNGLARGMENNSKVQWLFHPGMLFSSMDKWWKDFRPRQSAHEGIDITYYRRRPDELCCFGASIKVPAMDDGMILNICDDFLGKSLVVEHENSILFNTRIIFAYAHVMPEKGFKRGDIIQKEEVIARVGNTGKNPRLPPHLHFSCFEVPGHVKARDLNWELFSKSFDVNIIHPLFI
ncbi:MAG: M23 family metallopeptidase [Deltaproteobacteria bacterium]|nr:M23 family metallopeptidase [Deltaproteobacteria bacterium]